MNKTYSYKFEIGDRVFHKTPESDVGIILDISHHQLTNQVTYLVALGFNNEVSCLEEELSKEKVII